MTKNNEELRELLVSVARFGAAMNGNKVAKQKMNPPDTALFFIEVRIKNRIVEVLDRLEGQLIDSAPDEKSTQEQMFMKHFKAERERLK